MITRIRVLLLLARPAALVLFALCAALGVAEAGQARDAVLLATVLAVVVAFVLCCVAVNDLADERIDRVNLAGNRGRPLVTGTAARGDLSVIAAVAGLAAVAVAGWLGAIPLAVTATGLVIALGYSLRPVRVADRGGLAALVLPACYLAVPFLVGCTANGVAPSAEATTTLLGLYLGFVGRLLLKDFRDVRGDELFGKRTFLVRHGRRPTCLASGLAWTAGTALLVVVADNAFAAVALLTTGVVVGLLVLLARSTAPRRDERIIAAIAILGRGLLLDLLADLGVRQAHWSAQAVWAVLVALVITTLAAAREMLRCGPRPTRFAPPVRAATPKSHAYAGQSGTGDGEGAGSGRIEGCPTGQGSPASSAVPMPASRR